MTEIIIGGGNLLPPGLDQVKPASGGQTGGKDFSAVLKDAIEDIDKLQKAADEAIGKVQIDQTASIHEAIVALEKADVSFRAMMQVRNKILEAYQEIMRMQV